MKDMIKNIRLLAALAAVGSAMVAQAKTVYVQCTWESGLSQPASQIIEFYNGASKVGSVTVTKANGWKGSGDVSSAYDRVVPVPPNGAEAVVSERSYGCKLISQLTPGSDSVHVGATVGAATWRPWGDSAGAAQIEGWNGWQTVSAAQSANSPVYCLPAANGGPIYDVSNTKLKTIQFTASSVVATYDGLGHSINVSVTSPGSGATITYSTSSGGSFTSTKPSYVEVGTYTTYFKIEAPHYTTKTGSATVTINKAPIIFHAPSSSYYNDGSSHQISVEVLQPTSGYTIQYSQSAGGPWSGTNPSYNTIGAHTTYFQISASDTAHYISPTNGSATVTITEKQNIDCAVTGGTYIYDGAGHSVSVSKPSWATVRYSTDNKNFNLTTPPSYVNIGTYVTYVKITASGYNDWYGAATITILEKVFGPGDIDYPDRTNMTYTGEAPWKDKPGFYCCCYCTNCWDVGWWDVIFIGEGNYTGTFTNRFHISPKYATIYSASASKPYDGTPLVNDSVLATGFVTGQGLASGSAFGSQTDVGWSYNDFTYTLKANTNPNNYDLSIVTGKLSVVAVRPKSLKYPDRLDIVGPDRLDVGIPKSYSAYVTYSDGTSNMVSSTWSIAPNEPKARFTSRMPTSSAMVRALPKGAGETLTLSVPYTMTYGTGAVTNGIVAWYPFDDSAVTDMSIYNRTGEGRPDSVTRVADRSGASERAYHFVGTSDSHVSVVTPTPLDGVTNEFTISAWICPDDSRYHGILSRGGQFSFTVRSRGVWEFNGATWRAGVAYTTGKWQHIVLTRSGSTLCAYIDGVKRNEKTDFTGAISADKTASLLIGCSGSNYFNGSMDDVRIYNRALSAAEVDLIWRGADVTDVTVQKTVTATKTVTVNPTTTIPVALDVETPTGSKTDNTPDKLTFTTGSTASGGTGWYGQYETVYGAYNEDDYDAAQSGRTYGEGTSWMQTTVSGTGKISFHWKTECEKTYDYLVFKVGNKELARLSGTNDWRQMTFELTNAINHTLRWEYVKDGKNSLGKDAAWVDRLVWTKQTVPQKPAGVSTLVDATDGDFDTCVEVTWRVPVSDRAIIGYKLSRKETGKSDSTYVVLADGLTVREYRDYDAVPGVDYTYKVEAQNAAGWGNCGTDAGYRKVVVGVSPDSCTFSNVALNEQFFVVVISNAVWKAVPRQNWIHVTPTNGGFVVKVDNAVASSKRSGTVEVTCGLNASGGALKYSRTENFSVAQAARVDVAFVKPYNDWRTELQITTNGLAVADVYSPVPVFHAAEGMKISFGWKNNGDVEVEVPSVRFRVYNPTNPVPVMKWVDAGTSVEHGRILSPHSQTNSSFWSGAHLGALPPGDYKLEAELDPDDVLSDPVRSNNTAIFRFAVRNPALEFGRNVFIGDCWSNLEATVGSDFAQAPFVATRELSYTNSLGLMVQRSAPAVQFGPYVPMNGENGREITARKGVDIVFLVDFSSSMDRCIEGLVNNIGTFIDRLLLGDIDRGIQPIADLRIKVAGFSDIRSDCNFKNWFEEGVFTTDRRLLREKLEELRDQCYGGGGNGGESSYDALYYICKGWRTTWDPADKKKPTTYASYDPAEEERNGHLNTFRGTNVSARAVVMFTDEPPHVELDAPGCAGKGLNDLRNALMEADVNLTIIGDGYYYRQYQEYANNIHWFGDLISRSPQASNGTNRWVLVETSDGTRGEGTIAEFTQDTSRLQSLAETIYLQTPEDAVIEEPTFTATSCGEGTLKFRWCNDSRDFDNTAFTFVSEAGTITRGAGSSWEPLMTFEFSDGTHPFRWSYRKIDYAGAVSDCGLIADVVWEPKDIGLEVTPPRTEVDWLGTNKTQIVTNDAKIVNGVIEYTTNRVDGAVFDVKCNSIWRVDVDNLPDWITPVLGNGEGNGRFVVKVAENPLFGERLGAITVIAGEYGLPDDKILTKTVFIEQSGRPIEDGNVVRIHAIDIKPRWPWNSKVDIDFLVQTPSNTPVRVKVWGLNKEGAGMITYMEGGSIITNFPTIAMLQECAAKNGVEVGFGSDIYNPTTIAVNKDVTMDTNLGFTTNEVGGIEGDMAYILCPTSGLYRFTWNMAKDWTDASWNARSSTGLGSTFSPWANGGFHTPEFSVRMRATPVDPLKAADFDEKEAERAVRVDMRVSEMGITASDTPARKLSGGTVLTGWERIGHPFGRVDPVLIDTTDTSLFQSNGWNNLDFVKDLPDAYTNRYEFACVINDPSVAIEGGMITNDVHWTADKIHVVRDNVFVAKGAKLTIDAETIVKVCGCTRIYVIEDSTAEIVTNRHNIVVEGVYFARGYDSSYGGDTLYISSVGNQESLSDGQGIVYSQVQSGKKYETEEIFGSYKCSNRAIYRVVLAESWRNTNGVVKNTSPVWYKYYSRGQKYGDTILRPNKPGCAFYGWYTEQPTKNGILSTELCPTNSWNDKGLQVSIGYASSKQQYFVNPNECPFLLTGTYNSDKTIHALVCPTNWGEGIPEGEGVKPIMTDASHAIVTLQTNDVITLDGGIYGAFYNGKPHTPRIEMIKLPDRPPLPKACYEPDYGDYGGGFTTAGEYRVSAHFTSAYSGSPYAMFRVKPRPVDGSEVVFRPASSLYRPRRYGGVNRPSIKVRVPGMGDGGAIGEIPSGDYSYRWIDDDCWPNPGTYHVEITFNPNYSGVLTNSFEIEKNPYYDFTSPRTSVGTGAEAATRAKAELALDSGKPKRILYFGGEIPEDAETAYMKSLITDDVEFNEWVIDNFVVWTNNVNDADSPFEKYTEGLATVAYPLICVLNPDDLGNPVFRICGYMEKDELWALLRTELSGCVAASLADVEFKSGGDTLTYNGAVQCPTNSDLIVRYAGTRFRNTWYEIVPETNSVDVGTYRMRVRMRPNAVVGGYAVTGETASVTYQIAPCPVSDGAAAAVLAKLGVGLNPASATYDGEVHKPAVTSIVPYVSLDYGRNDWCNVGDHTLTVAFDGNYLGTISKTFTIVPKAVSAVVELDRYIEEVQNGKAASPLMPNVLKVSDRASGHVYELGADYDLSFQGGFVSAGTNWVVATFKNNYSGEARAAFVIEGASAVFEELDDLPSNPSNEQVLQALSKIAWTDSGVYCLTNNTSEYAGFKAWTESVGIDAAKGAAHAYVSYRVSELMDAVTNLASVAGLKFEIEDFAIEEPVSGSPSLCMTISLKDGGSAVALEARVAEAKARFAKLVRRAETIGGLASGVVRPEDVEVESVAGAPTKVRLSVKPPVGNAGFVKIVLE